MVLSKKKNTGLPDGPCVGVKINILLYIVTFHRDNDLKLKLREKSWHITQGSLCKKIGIKTKQILAWKKAYFGGRPVIQTVEAKKLDLFTKYSYFYKIFRPLKNQPFLSTTPPGSFRLAKGSGPKIVED